MSPCRSPRVSLWVTIRVRSSLKSQVRWFGFSGPVSCPAIESTERDERGLELFLLS